MVKNEVGVLEENRKKARPGEIGSSAKHSAYHSASTHFRRFSEHPWWLILGIHLARKKYSDIGSNSFLDVSVKVFLRWD